MVTCILMVAAVTAGLATATRRFRAKHEEDGHDRAARREENWYGHLMGSGQWRS